MKCVSAFLCLSSWICFQWMGIMQLSVASPVNPKSVEDRLHNATYASVGSQFKSSTSRPERRSPLDRVDVDSYLKNKRAMQLQIKCVVYDGPCDFVGKEVKKHIVSGLTGTCTDCSPRLRTSIEKVANYIQENYPQAWYDAIYKFLVAPTLGHTVKPTPASNSTDTDAVEEGSTVSPVEP